MDGDYRICRIMLAGKEHSNLNVLRLLLESVDGSLYVGQNILTLGSQFQERLQIRFFACKPFFQLDILFQPPPNLKNLLSLLLARPKLWLRNLLLQIQDLGCKELLMIW